MFNELTRSLTRFSVAIIFIVATTIAALAQTPSPTPVNPATQPPGMQLPPATAPPGTNVTPSTPQPSPVDPTMQEPRQPNFPAAQPQPLPPLPDLTRVGVQSSNVVSL